MRLGPYFSQSPSGRMSDSDAPRLRSGVFVSEILDTGGSMATTVAGCTTRRLFESNGPVMRK